MNHKKKSYTSHVFVPVLVGGETYTVEAEATEWGDASIGTYEYWGGRFSDPPKPYCESFDIIGVEDEDGTVGETVEKRVKAAVDSDPDLYSLVLTALDEGREEDGEEDERD